MTKSLLFDKKKVDLFLNYLSNASNLLMYQNNIEGDYQNFTTILSTSIKKFSVEVICKNKKNTTNPWYNNECKIAIKSIGDAFNESLKYYQINRYQTLIKKEKKRLYK
jgi:hypothetical protein